MLTNFLCIQIFMQVSISTAVDRLSCLMMSSSCDGPSRSDSWRNSLEENGCLEDKSIPTAEHTSSNPNSEEPLTNHSSEVPITNIDDFITELSKQEQHADSTEAHQAGSAETTNNPTDSATCQQEEREERGSESPAQAPARPSLLEFSTLDSGTNGGLLPAGKTFLQSYSRNFSNLTEKEATLPETNGKQLESGAELQPKRMYGSVEDSDSESDSTTDRTVQENRTSTNLSTGGGGGGVSFQDTDEEEEEVELCYNAPTRVEQKQSNDNGRLSPPQYTPPPPPQEDSLDNVELTQATDLLPKAEHEQVAPSHSASTNTQPTQTSGTVEGNGKSQDILARADPVCASAGTTVPTSVGDAVNGTTEANKKVLAPVKMDPSCPPAITSSPVTQNHITPRSQQRTARLMANSPQSSERVRGTSMAPAPTAAGSKIPTPSDAKSGGKISTLTAKDKEREREKGQASQNESKTTLIQNNSSAHSPRSSSLKEHPQSNCKLKSQDSKSLKSQSSSNPPKLKGLIIKSKNRTQNNEQPLTKPARAESPVQRKSTVSPIQSPKVQAKRVVSVGSPRITRTSEKSSASSSGRLCERTQEKSVCNTTGTTVLTQANVASSAKETRSVQQVAQLSQEPLKQNDKDKSELTTTQRTFIEVRLSSSSPTASSTPLLPRKQTVNPSSSSPVPENKSTSGAADLSQLKCETQLNWSSTPSTKCNSSQTYTAVSCITETVDKSPSTFSNGSVDHSLRMSSILDAGDHLRSSRSKLYLKAMERRSYSTDIRGLTDPNPFSVRQRIKSFENLVGFDKAVVRCIDVPYYAAKPQLNRTLSGCVDSCNGNSTTDGSRSLRRSLSSYADDPVSPPPSPQFRKVTTLDSRASGCGVDPVLEEPKLDRCSLAPPVLRQRNSRGPAGLTRSRLRELRALSMPELDKLCTEDFSTSPSSSSSSSSEAASNVTFKTELKVRPRKSADSSSEGPQSTLVTTKVSRSEGGLQGAALDENHYQVPRANGQISPSSASPSCSVR